MYIIYSTPVCVYCKKAKELMDEKGLAYREISLAARLDREQFKQENPSMKTVPQIFVEWEDEIEHIGGYEDLVKHLA
jgi:glutaredoxin